MQTTWTYIWSYLLKPSTLPSIIIPVLFIAFGLLFFKNSRKMTAKLAILGVLITPVVMHEPFTTWEIAEGSIGLHITPVFTAFLLIPLYFGLLDLKKDWFAVFAATWLNAVIVDVASGFVYFNLGTGTKSWPDNTWLQGIGGAGWIDGLVVLPIVSVTVLFFAQFAFSIKSMKLEQLKTFNRPML